MKWALLSIVSAMLILGAQESKPHSDTHTRNAAPKQNSASDPTGGSDVVVNQQTPQRQQDNHATNPPSLLHEYLLPPNILTLALVIVGIVGIVIAVCSLRKIDRQIGEMRRQVDVTMLQLRAMHEQVSEMSAQTALLKEYVGHTETTAKAALESANAAKVSADIAARVSVPILKVQKFGFDTTSAASTAAKLQFPNVEIVIKNYGQTPAFLIS